MAIDNHYPLVSVIIPVYNVVPYLQQSIESVINQTYKHLEIVIIDDGSTDGSGRICDNYQRIDSRIIVIHQENRGLSAARNTGLDSMSGEIVAFLDPDDYYEINMIEVMVKCLLNTHADIAICSYNIVKGQNSNQIQPFSIKQGVFSSKDALVLLLNGEINYGVWNKLYRCKVLEKLRFPEGHVYEDNYLIPEAFEKADRLVMINYPLIVYRKRSHSITTTYSEKNLLDWLRSRMKLDTFVYNRTPKVFSLKQRKHFNEELIEDLIRHYLNLLEHDSASDATKNAFQKEIAIRAKCISNYSLKTKAFYYSYKLNPYLTVYLRRFYNEIKRKTERISKCWKAS